MFKNDGYYEFDSLRIDDNENIIDKIFLFTVDKDQDFLMSQGLTL